LGLKLKAKQLQRLGLKPRRVKPITSKVLRLSAVVTKCRNQIEVTGESWSLNAAKTRSVWLTSKTSCIRSVDGGKLTRGNLKEGCHWRDYKTVVYKEFTMVHFLMTTNH